MYLARDVLDKEILDRDGFKGGKVDDLLLEWRADGPPMVRALVTQHGALARLLPGPLRRLGRWLRHAVLDLDPDLAPVEIAWRHVTRIDVTVRISGLFRDAFPNLVRLLNQAVDLVARLVEPMDWNFVRAHIARDTALLSAEKRLSSTESEKQRGIDALPPLSRRSVLSVEEATRRARLRVFGSKPGA